MSKLSLKKLIKLAVRSGKVFVYYLRRLIGKAPLELELTFIQKIRSSYILAGTRFVPAPCPYFSRLRTKLRVIDDVAGLPNVLWENHSQTQLPPPRKSPGMLPVETRWNTPLASFILTIGEGYVAPNGLVFDTNAVYRNAKWYYETPPDSLPIVHEEQLITFIQLWSDGFIHFTFDTLPRLNFAYDLICKEPNLSILVPDSPFITQVLKSLDIDSSRIIPQRKDHVYSADTVFYPHFYNNGLPQKMGLLPQGSLGKVREKLSGPYARPRDQIVYLKRRQNFTRSVQNEETLLNKIRKYLKKSLTLTVFEPDNDWTKDKEIMKCARVVLGPHGGAWSNIMFCKENTDVIEFLPLATLREQGLNERPCYYGLSNALNLKYWTIEPANFDFEKPGMVVPVDELLSVLEQIGVLEPSSG